MLDIISVPLGWIMRVCYSLVNNYFLALLLFAVIMQIVLLPFSIKQQKNSVRQAALAPKVAALRKKFAGRNDAATQQKMQEELQELYRRENFNPASGCLPLLIQMPILFALYNVVINPLRYISGLAAAEITALQTFMTDELSIALNQRSPYLDMLDHVRKNTGGLLESLQNAAGESADMLHAIADKLSNPDTTIPRVEFLGVDLSAVPTISFQPFDWLILVPICTIVFHFLTQKITRKFTYQSPETLEAQKSPSMRIMNWSMPLLSAWIALSVPAAIGIYWIFRGIIAAVQQIILSLIFPAPVFTEEDYKQAEKEMKVGKKVREKSKIPPKSLHRIDDEEYQAEYQKRLAEAEAEVAAEKEAARAEMEAKSGKNAKKGKSAVPALKEDEKSTYVKKDGGDAAAETAESEQNEQ